MLPLWTVEKPGFHQLISRLAMPSLKIKGRTFFTKLLKSEYTKRKDALVTALEKASDVGVTIDLWSTRRKSFLGETIHWFDENLNRKSACLAITRVKGHLTYDVLGRTIEETHVKFNIMSKLSMATTDNGSNFLKAFREFGSTSNAPSNDQLSDSETESEDENDVVYISLGDFLDAHDAANVLSDDSIIGADSTFNESVPDKALATGLCGRLPPKLPPHTRCACHLLNLICKTDVEKIKNSRFKTLKKSVESKLQKLCIKHNTSCINRETVEKHLNNLFVLKNDTRWNSNYNSMYRLHLFIKKQLSGLQQVMTSFGVELFRPVEIVYIKEYVKVMRPMVDALDILQGEKNVGMGFLLPTITILQRELQSMKEDSNITECKPLINSLLSSIYER